MLDSCTMAEKQREAFHTFLWHFFSSLKQNFIAYRSSKVSSRPDCIFEIHQLWQSGFSKVYSNCWCSCSFEPEIIKIGLSSHMMYSNNILNFEESTTILNVCTKKSLIECTTYTNTYTYVCIYIYMCVYMCSWTCECIYIYIYIYICKPCWLEMYNTLIAPLQEVKTPPNEVTRWPWVVTRHTWGRNPDGWLGLFVLD